MFIGIDQSITETAITILFSPSNYKVFSIKGKVLNLRPKIEYIYREAYVLIKKSHTAYTTGMSRNNTDIYCCIEGGSYGSEGRLFTLGQLSGMLISILISLDIAYREIPPATLKKFITGYGNAPKNCVMDFIKNKYDIRFTNDNKADSYVLALMAYKLKNEDTQYNFREEAEVIQSLLKPKIKRKKISHRRKKLEF
jgi:hypothetical protein